MINLLMFLSSSIAVAVGVAFAVGLAWIAVLIPVLISAAAGYGLVTLSRRRTRRSGTRSASSHRIRA
jgi:UPF0716 family protein affecting phage T7 exclusion